MISARAAGRTILVSLVTTRVELSQKVWYSSLSERASGISCKPPWCGKGRILGEAVSGDSPAESRKRGDLHVRFGRFKERVGRRFESNIMHFFFSKIRNSQLERERFPLPAINGNQFLKSKLTAFSLTLSSFPLADLAWRKPAYLAIQQKRRE